MQITDIASTWKQSCSHVKIAHNFSIQSLFTSSLHSHVVHSECTPPLFELYYAMKVSFAKANDNGSKGGNTFAKNLLAPILFYPKVDSSLGSDDEKPSERDGDAMVHEVCIHRFADI